MPNRRQFIRQLLSVGLVSQFDLDLDKLLWIPGAKKIFLPSLSYNDILTSEIEHILPHLTHIFENDSAFYTLIKSRDIEIINGRPLAIPLHFKGNENG